ncbi:cellulose-binding protein [Amycolatopsis thermoflava]|uniref:cellulose-binding protein n=1 Tax=Amycolatopsis thermoflava TaxID=84480 RepID=UPI003653CBE7
MGSDSTTTAARRDEDTELVPLSTDFDIRWRGYDRPQVQHWVQQAETELALLAADRDAAISERDDLAAELESTRAALRRLQDQFDQVCRTPITVEGLSHRMRRMVELAQDEAAEITARARAAADTSWAAAQEAAQQLRSRHIALIGELDRRRRDLEREHQDLLARIRADVEAMTTRAHAERAALDEQAARRRAEIEADFQRDLQARRAAVEQEIDALRSAARADAETMVREAEEVVHTLHRARDEALAQLRTARDLLAKALPLLHDDPPEPDPVTVEVPAQLAPLPARASAPAQDAPESVPVAA